MSLTSFETESPESNIDQVEVARNHEKIIAELESKLFHADRELYFSEREIENKTNELHNLYRILRKTQSELSRMRSAAYIFGTFLMAAIITSMVI